MAIYNKNKNLLSVYTAILYYLLFGSEQNNLLRQNRALIPLPARTDLNYTRRNPLFHKIPEIDIFWKWMFTFVLVNKENIDVRKLMDLKFSQKLEIN